MPLMSELTLTAFSNRVADIVSAASPSVVQVRGRRRPASGVVYAADVVVTTVRAVGSEDGVQVTAADGRLLDAELAGWDLTTHVAVLKVPGLGGSAVAASTAPVRVGQVALGVARSWSNSLTASAGIVAVIGGPLSTGRRRAIDQVIRVTAPMHDGFSGGLCLDAHRQHDFLEVAAEVVDVRAEIEIDRGIRRVRRQARTLRRFERDILDVDGLRRELRCIRVVGLAVRDLCFVCHDS